MNRTRVLCSALLALILLALPVLAADDPKDGSGEKTVGQATFVKDSSSSNQEEINTCFVNCNPSSSLQEFLINLSDNESCCQHCLDTCHVDACQSTQGSETIYCFRN